MAPTAVAFVPARGGSKRVPGKNLRFLAGHPLLAYTIAAARASSVFADVIVSTDDERTASAARHYGAEVPFLRPATLAGDTSMDIEWLEYTLGELARRDRRWDAFSILRPTSPFRQPETVCRAWTQFSPRFEVDSLRAVEKCRQHPGKMWVVSGDLMTPLLSGASPGHPWHSAPYQALPVVYVQNASLEMAWTRVVHETRTIAGQRVMPFFTEGQEGFDINDAEDWWLADGLLQRGEAVLPRVSLEPWEP